MIDNGTNSPSSLDIYEMQKQAEARVRQIQQQAKMAAQRLNAELYGEQPHTGSPSPEEKKKPPVSSLPPQPVRNSESLSASEDIKSYRVTYRNGFLGRNYPDVFEEKPQDNAERQSEGVERRGDGELREMDINREAQAVHVSVPSRPGSRKATDYLSPEDREKEFRKKHYISMPTEIPDRYRYVIPSTKREEDRPESKDSQPAKRNDNISREATVSVSHKPQKQPEKRREPDNSHIDHGKGIASLAGALNLNSNALESDEMLLLTLIILLAEEGADIGLILALMYILV